MHVHYLKTTYYKTLWMIANKIFGVQQVTRQYIPLHVFSFLQIMERDICHQGR